LLQNRAAAEAVSEFEQLYVHTPGPFGDYVQHVETYTKRALTFPSDFLNAFSGITGMLLARDENFSSFVYGLPVNFFE
jgi:hypothetical protein